MICPVANRGEQLRVTVESVLGQTFEDWELLLISDGSTDSTDDIAREFAAIDQRVKFHRLRRHGHPGPLRTFGHEAALGELVAYLDHDDVYMPGHLAAMVAEGDQGWVVSSASYVDDSRRVTRTVADPDLMWSRELQICAPIFEPSRVMCHRRITQQVGAWTLGPAGLEDWDYWERMSALGVRPRLIDVPSVEILEGPNTRRGRLQTEFVQVIAHTETVGDAQSLIAAIYTDLRRSVIDAKTRDLMAWIEDEEVCGHLELPRGRLLAQMSDGWEIEPDFLIHESLLALSVGDHAAVGFPLPCVRAEHADLSDEVFRRRHPRLLRLLAG